MLTAGPGGEGGLAEAADGRAQAWAGPPVRRGRKTPTHFTLRRGESWGARAVSGCPVPSLPAESHSTAEGHTRGPPCVIIVLPPGDGHRREQDRGLLGPVPGTVPAQPPARRSGRPGRARQPCRRRWGPGAGAASGAGRPPARRCPVNAGGADGEMRPPPLLRGCREQVLFN